MKKKYLFTLSLLATIGAHAQVGVNNTDPKASLHITPQKTDGSTAEGIIAPNLTRAQLISKDARYTVAQKGAIVYVTTVDGSVTTKTNKVTTVGYYYFDGVIWLPFGSGATVTVPTEPWQVQGSTTQATGNNQDIYQSGSVAVGSNTAGTYKFQVTGTSHVTENSRVGSSTVVGAQTVGSTLGVTGATTLANTLKVTGGTNLNSTLSVLGATTIASTGSFTLQGNGAGAGKYLASDAAGKGTWSALPATATTEPWRVQGGTALATANTDHIYQKGKVAIGVAKTDGVIAEALWVDGRTKITDNTSIGKAGVVGTTLDTGTPGTGNLKVHGIGDIGTSNAVYAGTNYAMQIYGRGAVGGLWVENSTNLRRTTTIGAALPATTHALIVENGITTLKGATKITAAGSFTLEGNGVGAGKFLTSDAAGKGTWSALPATATTEPWRVQGGTTLATANTDNIYQKGKVAIGPNVNATTKYDKSLYVNGATLFQGETQVGTSNANASFAVQGQSTLNNKVGIGRFPATSEDYILAIKGNTHQEGELRITSTGDFLLEGHGAANGHVLSSDANGKATWKNQNMLSGSWFYLPSFNFDMSSLTPKTVNLFDLGTKQLLAASTTVGSSPGAAKPTLPTVATAYDYIVVGTSGHVTNISITASGVMTYTPTTTNPPIDAYVNIIVRVK